MPKKDEQQQRIIVDEIADVPPAAVAAVRDMIAARARISPFECDPDFPQVRAAADNETSLEVMSWSGDSYHVIEDEGRGPDRPRARAYRTVQRIDLATRLQLAADYDPADLVGRTFLVPA